MKDIIDRLKKANVAYYTTGDSELSDDEYDALREYARENGHDVSTLTAPPPGTGWKVQEHLKFMSSIPDAPKTLEDFKKIVGPNPMGEVSLKYDGMSLECIYVEGRLLNCILRGDGSKGEDVYNNACLVRGIPHTIPYTKTEIAVYGEVVISYNNLQALNEFRENDGLKPYSSPRSAVAMVRSMTASRRHMKLFAFRAFDVYSPIEMPNQEEWMKWLTALTAEEGIRHLKFDPVSVVTECAEDAWKRMLQVANERDEFQYQIDGLVFRTNDRSVKIKFPSESVVTTVLGVTEQLGRTGVIAPVITFEPVNLVGAEVRRASAHNAVLVKDRLAGLGIGAKILVSRRGDVIPHVEEVVEPANPEYHWRPLHTCPSCDSPVWQDGSIRRCSADPGDCSGTEMGLILEFCRRLGIEGLGPGVVTALMDAELVFSPPDLFALQEDVVAEAVMPGGQCIGLARAKTICRNIWDKSTVTYGELFGAVCIPGCAMSVMESVMSVYDDPEDLMMATAQELERIDGVGPERAAAITWYVDARWDDVIRPLLMAMQISRIGKTLSGKTFCITLGLNTCGRTEMEARIRRAGGTVKSSVSKKVTHLICNFPDEGTTKLNRAKELGIPIISEEQLFEMMGRRTSQHRDGD